MAELVGPGSGIAAAIYKSLPRPPCAKTSQVADCDSSQKAPYPPPHTPHTALGPILLYHVTPSASRAARDVSIDVLYDEAELDADFW